MRLFFSVGEPSGDLHTARLIRELRVLDPNCEVSGLGGPQMQAAGCQLHFRLTDLAVMGVFAVLPMLGRFLSVLWQVGRWLDADRPNAVVLVDFPGFNWWVARMAKRRGIEVIYLLPPQMWAWASWRVHKMRRLVDWTLCALPFEHRWYQERGVPATLIGHPFFDEVSERQLDQAFLAEQAAHPGPGPVVAILPGSRRQEVTVNFPVQLAVMRLLHERIPGVRFLVANYRAPQREHCQRVFAEQGGDLPVEFHVGRTSEILESSRVCLMVSGSVSLEVLARRRPAVVLYGVGWANWIIGRLLIRCRFISLPNLLADRPLMPEFVLRTPTPEAIEDMAGLLTDWLTNPTHYLTKAAELEALAVQITHPGATKEAARWLHARLGEAKQSPAPATAKNATESATDLGATDATSARNSVGDTHPAVPRRAA